MHKKNLSARCAWAMLIVGLFMPIFVTSDQWIRVADMALIFAILALGLNIIVGYTGLLDLGFMAFFGIGSYSYALLASPHLLQNIPWIADSFPNGFPAFFSSMVFAIPVAMMVSGLLGALQGVLIRPLFGDYLAIVTLGFGEIIRILLNNLGSPVNITNGPQGISDIASLQMFGWNLSEPLFLSIPIPFFSSGPDNVARVIEITISSLSVQYYGFLFFLLLSAFLSIRIRNSRIGRAWIAIRENEMAASAMGIDGRNLKVLSFSVGAMFAGLAGVLFAGFQGFVSPENFNFIESAMLVAMVVMGGAGNVTGVILGAVVLYSLPEALRSASQPIQLALFGSTPIPPEALRMLLFGIGLVAIMRVRPNGLLEAEC